MILQKIYLKDFRNYEVQSLDFSDKFNFIYGNNGQGKTNILEAISYLSFTKSFLGTSEYDCVRIGADEFLIDGCFQHLNGNSDNVIMKYNKDLRSKSVLLNKQKTGNVTSEIFGRFPSVFLSPHDLKITYGNPSDRRRFFDILNSQCSRVYFDLLRDLNKLLKQKNALLKKYSSDRSYSYSQLTDLLNAYNTKLSEISAEIIFRRLRFLNEFLVFFKKNFSFLIRKEQEADISYESGFDEIKNDPEIQKEDIREIYNKRLINIMPEEIKRCLSLAGPQRDDYQMSMEKDVAFDLKHFASQGEHKTFLVALKLSEYDHLKSVREVNPVLLLDDVLSELDENRVSMIVSHLKDFGQIFLTTTNFEYSDSLKKFYNENEIKVMKIVNGKAA
ncbi:DNA replication and repair protein RecF [soil metagenome]